VVRSRLAGSLCIANCPRDAGAPISFNDNDKYQIENEKCTVVSVISVALPYFPRRHDSLFFDHGKEFGNFFYLRPDRIT